MSRTRFTTRRILIVTIVIALVLASATAAFAYWTGTGSGSGASTADTVNTGATPTGSVSGSAVTLNWTASTTATRNAAVDGYVVKRYIAASGGSAATPGGTCTGTVAALTCQDTGLADGTYYYTVTPKLANWLGNESPTRGGPFTVITAVATKLSFTTQPSSGQNIQATGTGTFSVSVAIQDASNNTITADTRNVTLAINNNAGPGGVLSCSNAGGLTVAAVSGVANFTGCAITKAGTGYTLTASSSPSLTAPTNANSFNITAGAATQLVFTTQPVGNVAEGTNFNTSPVVQVQDTNGNRVTTDNAAVTLAINTGPGSGVLSCTNAGGLAATAASGIATFSGCQINGTAAAGSYTLKATRSGLTTGISASFTINPGIATKLAFTTQPVGNVAEGTNFTTSPVVQVQDANGNLVNDNGAVTLTKASGPGGTLSCTNAGFPTINAVAGVATFTNCQITGTGGAGSYTLQAARSGLTSGTSASFTINPGTATKLAFTTTPSSSTGGVAFATQPQVTVQDANSNTVTTDASTVTLAITAGTPTSGGPGTLSGCSQSETAGVITFSGCKIDKVGAGYKLHATDASLAAADSNAFSITLGTATQLAFTQQPNGGANNVAWTGQPQVTVQDAGGNTVSSTASITLSVASQPTSGAVLTCTANPKNASGGVDTFAGCNIVGTAGAYTLSATASGLTSATSSSFNITAGTASQLEITSSAFSATASTSATSAFTVTLEDSGGNPTTKGTATTVNLSSTSTGKKFASTSGGTSVPSVTLSANTQSVTAYYADTAAGTPTITASASGLTSDTQQETITATAFAGFGLANCVVQGASQACNGTYKLGNGGAMVANVRAVDQFGNDTTIPGTLNLSVVSASPSTYAITTGSTLTIDGTATPPNQSTGTFTIDKNGNSNNSTTITIRLTSGATGIPDLTFTVQK